MWRRKARCLCSFADEAHQAAHQHGVRWEWLKWRLGGDTNTTPARGAIFMDFHQISCVVITIRTAWKFCIGTVSFNGFDVSVDSTETSTDMTIQRTYEPTDLASKHSESKRARILYPYQVTELVLVSIPSRTAAARSARVIGPPAAGTKVALGGAQLPTPPPMYRRNKQRPSRARGWPLWDAQAGSYSCA